MATLKQRILRRAVPVGVITALVGYGLLWAYLSAAAAFTDVGAIQSEGPNYSGPLVLGVTGFAIAAALECVRPGKP
ncbi:MAG TPA: hypothetical protein VGF55_03970 [Gemmataceae bacterium]|jgi:hypothetical protein